MFSIAAIHAVNVGQLAYCCQRHSGVTSVATSAIDGHWRP
jgi:hypothetical protein